MAISNTHYRYANVPHTINVLFDFTMDVPSSDWTWPIRARNEKTRRSNKKRPASDKTRKKRERFIKTHHAGASRSGKLATSFVNGFILVVHLVQCSSSLFSLFFFFSFLNVCCTKKLAVKPGRWTAGLNSLAILGRKEEISQRLITNASLFIKETIRRIFLEGKHVGINK